MPITGPAYRGPEQYHGPCYVLDPKAWMRGERIVLRTIPPIAEKPKRRKIYRWGHAAAREMTGETRRFAVWPKGHPELWRLVERPVMRRAPSWHAEARALRKEGWSVREIMRRLGVRNFREMHRVISS